MRPEERVAAYLAKNLGYSDEKRKVMAYGLGALFQMLMLFAIAFVFGILFRCLAESMILFWGVGLMRRTTGGVHCQTYLGCVFTSALSNCVIALFCRFMPLEGTELFRAIFVAVTFLTAGYVFFKRVPVEAPNKPIRKPEKIKRLRWECLVTTLVYLAATIVLMILDSCRSTHCMYALCAVMWWMCFTLTSVSGRFARFMDSLFMNEQN